MRHAIALLGVAILIAQCTPPSETRRPARQPPERRSTAMRTVTPPPQPRPARRTRPAPPRITAAQHAKCGADAEAHAHNNPRLANADQSYWKAGRCYEKAGMHGPAIRMFRGLVSRYPRSRFKPRAVLHMARNFDRLAMFAEAAKNYERFATQHPRQRGAPQALQRAVQLWAAQGDHKLLLKSAAQFLKRFGRKHKRLSARVFWIIVQHYKRLKDDDKHLINLGRYVRAYAAKGDVQVALEALVTLGAIWWKRSCPVVMIDGECKRIRKVRKKGKKKKRAVVTYVARDKKIVKRARALFVRTLKVWANGRALGRIPKSAPDRSLLVHWTRHFAAQAKFMLAELQLESYLTLKHPAKLNFDPKNLQRARDSLKQFNTWLTGRLKTGARLVREYMSVVTGIRVKVDGKKRGDAHWSIAAVARAGTIFQSFGDQLTNAPIPLHLKSVAARDAYKAHMEKIANPVLSKAQGGYKICLKLSQKLRFHNEWSRLCEREINHMLPSLYPLANELRPPAGVHAPLAPTPNLKKLVRTFIKTPENVATNLALAAALEIPARQGKAAPTALVKFWKRLRFTPRTAADAAELHLRMVRANMSAERTPQAAARGLRGYAMLVRLYTDQFQGRGATAAKALKAKMVYSQGRRFLRSRADPAGTCKSPRKPTAVDQAAAQLAAARGRLALKTGKSHQALASFDRALACDGSLLDARMNRAALALQLRLYGQAKTHYAAVVKARPRYVDGLLGLAVAYRGMASVRPANLIKTPPKHWYGLARAQYQAALRAVPKDTRALFNLGLLHLDYLNDLAQAKKYFRRYVRKPARRTTAALRKKARQHLRDIAYQQKIRKITPPVRRRRRP